MTYLISVRTTPLSLLGSLDRAKLLPSMLKDYVKTILRGCLINIARAAKVSVFVAA